MLVSVCSRELLIEPERRCFSRDTSLSRREKYRELSQNAGVTTRDTAASSGWIQKRATVKTTSSTA